VAKISTSHKLTRQADEALNDPITWEPSLAFVRYSISALLIGTALFALVILVFYPEMKWRLLGPVLMALVGLVGWYLIRQGRPQVALKTMAVGMWSTVSVLVFFNGGILAPAYYIFPILVMLSGWLLNARAAMTAAVLTSLLTVFFVLGEHLGWLPPTKQAPLVLNGIVLVCILMTSALLVNSLVRSYKKQIQKLHAINVGYASAPMTWNGSKRNCTRPRPWPGWVAGSTTSPWIPCGCRTRPAASSACPPARKAATKPT